MKVVRQEMQAARTVGFGLLDWCRGSKLLEKVCTIRKRGADAVDGGKRTAFQGRRVVCGV